MKPANVKLTEAGKVVEADSASSMSPTINRDATRVGVILGTAAYMSPEQAKGKLVDKRADVWAFGAVLYEMLAGRRAFEGEDVSDTLAAVLRAEPDFDALPARTPRAVRQVLRLCLIKDHKERARDIGDVALAIHGGFDGSVPGRARACSSVAASQRLRVSVRRRRDRGALLELASARSAARHAVYDKTRAFGLSATRDPRYILLTTVAGAADLASTMWRTDAHPLRPLTVEL